MTRAITTPHRNAIESARWRMLREQANNGIQDEIIAAKHIQRQTGCTWTEALRAAYRRKAP